MCVLLMRCRTKCAKLSLPLRRLVGSEAFRSRRAVARLPTTRAFAFFKNAVRLNESIERDGERGYHSTIEGMDINLWNRGRRI